MLNTKIDDKDMYKYKLDFIYKAIDDTQNGIRFADTKAAAIVAFWGLICTIIVRTGKDLVEHISQLKSGAEFLLVLGCLLVCIISFIQSIWLVYLSINPRSNPSRHIYKSSLQPKGLFYLAEMNSHTDLFKLLRSDPKVKLKMPLNDYVSKMSSLSGEELYSELVFELQKVSFIRNLKLARVDNAIKAVHRFFISCLLVISLLVGNYISGIKGLPSLDFKLNVELSLIFIGMHILLEFVYKYLPEKDTVHLLGPLFKAAFLFGTVLIIMGTFHWPYFIIYITMQYVLQKDYLFGNSKLKWLLKRIAPIIIIILISLTY
ncbi:hypothetical protein [Cohnella hashimotonis]|uniref:Pycsar effector protein domain-containing protein n=1 Tax=Cohnella hashimotonis TaxID=2826895 RepID=A0ABT6TCD1_9BACL|nr:hypothetical protein [Cohnella hashimotonis]MDI4643482.1 hypothetical protein [Cohnella hashimotonis]